METSQRYIVRELSGFSINATATSAGNQKETTDVMVLDRWDCCHVVAYFEAKAGGGSQRLDQRQLRAAALAHKLEQDHRRELSLP